MWSILGFCGLIGLEVAASCTTMSSQMESGWVGSAIVIQVLGLAPTANHLAGQLFASLTAERDP